MGGVLGAPNREPLTCSATKVTPTLLERGEHDGLDRGEVAKTLHPPAAPPQLLRAGDPVRPSRRRRVLHQMRDQAAEDRGGVFGQEAAPHPANGLHPVAW